MSLLLQIAIGLIVAGGIGFGVYHKHEEKMIQQETTLRDQQMNTTSTASVRLNTGNTNADLDADLKSIDGELKAVGDASVGIDQSMTER